MTSVRMVRMMMGHLVLWPTVWVGLIRMPSSRLRKLLLPEFWSPKTDGQQA